MTERTTEGQTAPRRLFYCERPALSVCQVGLKGKLSLGVWIEWHLGITLQPDSAT